MTSWVCIISALPFALLGFVSYNGMTADQFARTWIRSEILFPRVLIYRSSNPIILKSEFILSLCEMAVGTGVLSAKEKSLMRDFEKRVLMA